MPRVSDELRKRKADWNVRTLAREGYDVSRPDPHGPAFVGKVKLHKMLLEEMSPAQLLNIVRFLTCRARRFA